MNWNWGKSIALVVTVFILFCFSIIYITSSNHTSLVASDYYQQELAYDQHKKLIQNGLPFQSQFNAIYTGQDETLRINFPKLLEIKGKIHLYKPSDESQDIIQEIQLDSLYGQNITLNKRLAYGLWRLKINWQSANVDYFNEIRIDL